VYICIYACTRSLVCYVGPVFYNLGVMCYVYAMPYVMDVFETGLLSLSLSVCNGQHSVTIIVSVYSIGNICNVHLFAMPSKRPARRRATLLLAARFLLTCYLCLYSTQHFIARFRGKNFSREAKLLCDLVEICCLKRRWKYFSILSFCDVFVEIQWFFATEFFKLKKSMFSSFILI